MMMMVIIKDISSLM